MKGLVEKDYNSLEGINAPDYVLIFVPLESALSSALKSRLGYSKTRDAKSDGICNSYKSYFYFEDG